MTIVVALMSKPKHSPEEDGGWHQFQGPFAEAPLADQDGYLQFVPTAGADVGHVGFVLLTLVRACGFAEGVAGHLCQPDRVDRPFHTMLRFWSSIWGIAGLSVVLFCSSVM